MKENAILSCAVLGWQEAYLSVLPVGKGLQEAGMQVAFQHEPLMAPI